jgi:TPR repeat protein
MYNLALMYTYGRGPDTGGEFTQNAEKAVRLFELAAAANHAQSIYYIGM